MSRSRLHSLRAGFTLVELLTAIAVLAIIVVAASQILGTAASLTTVNNKHMDANDQARMVFDRMADDFARMVRRKDVDYLFWKNSVTTGTLNDAMYFFTEGASNFVTTAFPTESGTGYSPSAPAPAKNSVSLVGYRVNSLSTSSDYNQLERLGKALSWDGGAYNSTQSATLNSKQPNFMVFLTYDPVGYDPKTASANDQKDPSGITTYSNAFFNSTLAGAYSDNANGVPIRSLTTTPSTVGTEANNFDDSKDISYRSVGSQVFRFEYAFQLKDGTYSDKPMMVYSSGSSNGVPSSTVAAITHPLPTNDSATQLATPGTVYTAVGSRWWDSTNHIGYICLDPTHTTSGIAIWHEIGIQDISAVIVTIAVIDKQGLATIKAKAGDLSKIAAVLPDYNAATTAAVTGTVVGDPAYLLNPSATTGWAYALLPGKAVSALASPNNLPQAMISQIRLYQRYFYLNTF